MADPRPLAILFNPSAGKGRALRARARLEEALRKRGVGYELIVTESEGRLRDLTRELASAGRPLAGAGGDSTFQIMINEMMAARADVPLGLIGIGSSNDIPLALGVGTLDEACRALAAAAPRRLDLGAVEAEVFPVLYFLGQANIGLGASVNAYVENLSRRKPRLARHQMAAGIMGVLRALKRKEVPVRLAVSTAGEHLEGAFTLAVFSNTRLWATGRAIAPDASPEDGVLDACLIDAASFARLARLASLARRGKHAGERDVHLLRGAAFEVFSDMPFAVQADGELLGPPGHPAAVRRLRISAVPAAISIFL
jgi:diacylglycerol kinase family enzyme